jgi:hypothetical protein
MLLWIALILTVWTAVLVLMVAVCRAAAAGDVAQRRAAHRASRFARPACSGRRVRPRRLRMHA